MSDQSGENDRRIADIINQRVGAAWRVIVKLSPIL
jgi:hypothetical protein